MAAKSWPKVQINLQGCGVHLVPSCFSKVDRTLMNDATKLQFANCGVSSETSNRGVRSETSNRYSLGAACDADAVLRFLAISTQQKT